MPTSAQTVLEGGASATLKVAEYTEKTSNACAPNVQLNYLKQK